MSESAVRGLTSARLTGSLVLGLSLELSEGVALGVACTLCVGSGSVPIRLGISTTSGL